ncbi:hypothetical protein [Flammeovirga kamogawensis]|uniref:Plasminogen-binding protein PgbA N-terminal domain-containing protein n=1 Tax=Flammeovirga kamogawensis TaxID=373891 RepID=A0ABX8GY31_9BACT|nr:hypothetical protein [Flammeovirga kamogawensis]MBB6460759.1 hypothetical protein [Flammeovirga kamogawensis]QWG08112.1 hypothetical protein KM029_04010 [Flammeovirga kamogawensis]TRX69915.1 hypothetical protein EO216_17950 [Flammeovirga kamogawensis]
MKLKRNIQHILFLLIVLTSTGANAQELYVLHVNGNIVNTTNNTNLAVGDVITKSTSLNFASNDSKAIVIGTESGKMLLDGSKITATPDGEFMSLVTDVLFPVNSNKQMSTRSVTFDTIHHVSDYFNGAPYVFIADSIILEIDSIKYKLDDEKMMAIRFSDGDNVYNRWIPNYGNNQVIIMPDSLFKGAVTEKIEVVDLYYVIKATRDVKPIGSFIPVFINQHKLKEELLSLKTFLNNNTKTPEQEVERELYQYILDIYGKTDYRIFKNWVVQEGII